jgi:cbb3-type cytochrome oxidase maturation protein
MNVLMMTIPLSIVLGLVGLAAFLWSLRSDQYRDPEGDAARILFRGEDRPAQPPGDPPSHPPSDPPSDPPSHPPSDPPSDPPSHPMSASGPDAAPTVPDGDGAPVKTTAPPR